MTNPLLRLVLPSALSVLAVLWGCDRADTESPRPPPEGDGGVASSDAGAPVEDASPLSHDDGGTEEDASVLPPGECATGAAEIAMDASGVIAKSVVGRGDHYAVLYDTATERYLVRVTPSGTVLARDLLGTSRGFWDPARILELGGALVLVEADRVQRVDADDAGALSRRTPIPISLAASSVDAEGTLNGAGWIGDPGAFVFARIRLDDTDPTGLSLATTTVDHPDVRRATRFGVTTSRLLAFLDGDAWVDWRVMELQIGEGGAAYRVLSDTTWGAREIAAVEPARGLAGFIVATGEHVGPGRGGFVPQLHHVEDGVATALARHLRADPDAWAYGVHASIATDDGGAIIVGFGGEGENWTESTIDPLAVELRTGGSVFSLSAPLLEGQSLDGNVEVAVLSPESRESPFAAVYGLDASVDPVRESATRLGFRCVTAR